MVEALLCFSMVKALVWWRYLYGGGASMAISSRGGDVSMLDELLWWMRLHGGCVIMVEVLF